MKIVSQVFSKIACGYFEQALSDNLECRLLVPAPTEKVGYELQKTLRDALPNGVGSFLVIDPQEHVPSEEKGWMYANGLTSKRIGSFAVITQPGQLSRVQESIVGSGGAVRLSIGDEWPWIRDHEDQAFSFSEVVLPGIVESWTDEVGTQSWLSGLIEKSIAPSVRKSVNRANIFFDELLDEFDPDEHDSCGDIKQRFLYHCGIPSSPDLGDVPDAFLRSTSGLCESIFQRMQVTPRSVVLENAKELAGKKKKKRKKLMACVNAFFDGYGSGQWSGISILALSNCLQGLSLKQWTALDTVTLAALFEIRTDIQFDLNSTLLTKTGFLSRDNKALVDKYKAKLKVKVEWNITGDKAVPEHYVIELKHGQKRIALTDPLTKKSGTTKFKVNTENVFPDTTAKKIVLSAKLIDTHDQISGVVKSNTTHLYLLHTLRPCVVAIQDPFLVVDAIKDADEEDFDGVTIDEPLFAYFLDSRKKKKCDVTIDGSKEKLIKGDPWILRTSSPIDPGQEPSGQTVIHADFGDGLSAWLNLETTSVISGELCIESELVRQFKKGNAAKVKAIYDRFSGDVEIPYPSLGGITEDNEARIHLAKEMESPNNGESPLIIDFHRSSVIRRVSRHGPIKAVDNTEEDCKTFSGLTLEPDANNLLDCYVEKRSAVLDLFTNHFQDEGTSYKHPLYARTPTFIDKKQHEIETAIVEYLESYIEILELLSEPRKLDRSSVFVLTYLDCVVGTSSGGNLNSPCFLIGPWHPIVVAQRFQRQAVICAAIKSWLDNKGSINNLGSVLGDIDGHRRVHALSDTTMHFENAYVSDTSDPGWCFAVKTERSEQFLELSIALRSSMGLEIDAVPRGTEALTQSYVKRFLEANPAERRLEIRIRKGLNLIQVVRALEDVLYD